MSEKGKASISVILVMVFVLGLFSPMSQHARAAIPVPHNQYGHAWDYNGVDLPDGSLVSAWIDGVTYGWNWTFPDPADPDPFNRTSKIDIDTAGNQVTIPGDPDTPWVKEGGDDSVDDIMYVWGDMTGITVILEQPTTIFEQTTIWRTFVSEYINLSIAPTQPPALPKINNIVTQPGDLGTQYIYIYGPQGTPMDEFYLEKNDGLIQNPGTRIYLSGAISETNYFYVDLGATDYLDINGDELKLVWENPGGAGTPFGGNDVVVDRVEFNQTVGGTHYGEPDNTIMQDAPAPGFNPLQNSDIHRVPTAGSDTNDCLADFAPGMIGRPPNAPYPLSVEGVQALGPGETIDHVTNRVNPVLGWNSASDPEGDPQFGYRIEVANDSAFADTRWSSYQPASIADNEAYAGLALEPGTCYYYRAKIKDGKDYGPWANTTMCMNTPPPVPENRWPHNETISPIDVVIFWSNVTDAEDDAVQYELQVDEDETFSLPPFFHSESTWNNYSIQVTYLGLRQYYYRVRAHDGYEYSGWSNETGYWYFITSSPPTPPDAVFLAVEGFYEFSPDILHLVNRVNPLLNWSIYDINGDGQLSYELEIRDGAGGTGNLIWPDAGGTIQQVTYGGPELAECTDYYFRVRLQDDSASQLWGTWSEIMFHSNCVPTIPMLVDPADGSSLSENPGQVVVWAPSTDGDSDPITYEWVVDYECPPVPPYVANGTTSSTISGPFQTVAGNYYNWTVRAWDGWEWSDWAVCFMFYVPIPKQRPGPALNLTVDGYIDTDPEINHSLNPTPTFAWEFNDPDVGDTQGAIHVRVSESVSGTIRWDFNQSYTLESIVYGGGILPQPCTGYYFRILTADNDGYWARASDWSEIYFHLNCAPTVPTPTTPADGDVLPPSTAETVGWDPSTDADPDDTISYELEVNETDGTPVWSETTAGTTSTPFATTGGKCYVWRVRATDGWEYSPWSNVFGFCANTPPDLPSDLMVEGFTVADVDERMHIMVSQPTFNWTFTDPDGDSQAEYAVEVWTDPDGTGTMMWNDTDTTSANTTTYARTTLVQGESYYYRVNVSDGLEWSGWSELQFNMSAPPPAPQLQDPADNAVDVTTTPLLNWSGVVDPNGDTITYHWYLDNETTVTAPFLQEGTTTDTNVSTTTALEESTDYYWKVCADDGWEQPQCSSPWKFTTAAPPNQDPVADAGPDQTVEVGETVNFNGTGSSDPDGTITSYSWDFGDDTTGTGPTPTHSYSETGIYTVTLNVTDDQGAWDTDTVVITVEEKEKPPVDILGQYWWILLIIIIIIVLLIILLAKRKKPEEEEEEILPEEEEEAPPPPAEEEVEEAPEEAVEEEEKAEMKECPNCGTVLAADDTECFMCGARV